jgi:hypothetical protein
MGGFLPDFVDPVGREEAREGQEGRGVGNGIECFVE